MHWKTASWALMVFVALGTGVGSALAQIATTKPAQHANVEVVGIQEACKYFGKPFRMELLPLGENPFNSFTSWWGTELTSLPTVFRAHGLQSAYFRYTGDRLITRTSEPDDTGRYSSMSAVKEAGQQVFLNGILEEVWKGNVVLLRDFGVLQGRQYQTLPFNDPSDNLVPHASGHDSRGKVTLGKGLYVLTKGDSPENPNVLNCITHRHMSLPTQGSKDWWYFMLSSSNRPFEYWGEAVVIYGPLAPTDKKPADKESAATETTTSKEPETIKK